MIVLDERLFLVMQIFGCVFIIVVAIALLFFVFIMLDGYFKYEYGYHIIDTVKIQSMS